MALIQCPECGREISDKVSACPHCGYPFAAQDSLPVSSEPPVSADTNVLAPVPKKSQVLAIVIVTILVIIAIVISMVMKKSNDEKKIRNTYIDNISEARTEMLVGAMYAEEVCVLVHDVWYDTIYEEYDFDTYVYTRDEQGHYHEDFNDSIQALYADSEIQDTISAIKDSKKDVDALMKRLQTPADEFSICYETLDALYDSYCGLVALAISPSGSLKSYTESYREYDGSFGRYYDKLGTQIPEKED